MFLRRIAEVRMEFEDFKDILPKGSIADLTATESARDNIYIVPQINSEKEFIEYFGLCMKSMRYVRDFKDSMKNFTHLKIDFDAFDKRNSEVDEDVPMIAGSIDSLLEDDHYKQLKKEIDPGCEGYRRSRMSRRMKAELSHICAELETFREFTEDFRTKYMIYKDSFYDGVLPARRKRAVKGLLVTAGVISGIVALYLGFVNINNAVQKHNAEVESKQRSYSESTNVIKEGESLYLPGLRDDGTESIVTYEDISSDMPESYKTEDTGSGVGKLISEDNSSGY